MSEKMSLKGHEKCKIEALYPKLSYIDMIYFFETKLSNIGHFFQFRQCVC